ncbi:MAG: hypothetical protein L0227_05650 [Chloroflexi bacterium]|nr:hypothetical protein [Chloroflexota bacterium]
MTGPSPAPTPSPTLPPTLPPDPQAYDEVRNEHARKRGLAAPYIAGGRDPNPEAGQAEERRYLRWLLIMVVAIVLSGFVLGILANLIAPGG